MGSRDLLEGETAAAVLIEAIPTLGSLAHGEPKHAVAVCSPGVVTALLKKLSHPDNEVVACSARCAPVSLVVGAALCWRVRVPKESASLSTLVLNILLKQGVKGNFQRSGTR